MVKLKVLTLLIVSAFLLTACIPQADKKTDTGSEDKAMVEEGSDESAGEEATDEEMVDMEEIVVKVTDTGFEPKEVTVKKGQTVRWVNESKDSAWVASAFHPTHEVYPEFDQLKGMKNGESWSFTFDKVGEWKYHCHLVATKFGLVKVTE